jgi:hypothetical protein
VIRRSEHDHSIDLQLSAGRASKRMSNRLLREVMQQNRLLNSCRKGDQRCVYIFELRRGVGYIKIGTTVDLQKRAGDHQGNAYDELRLIAAFHGDGELERSLHLRFSKDRVWGHREHFYRSRAVMRWVEDVTRLNGRDSHLCWSCRDAEVRRQASVLPPLFDLDIQPLLVSSRCDRKSKSDQPLCRAAHTWFKRESGECVTSAYEPASDVARSLISNSPNYTAWAVRLWIESQTGRKSTNACWFASRLLYRQVPLRADDTRVLDAMPDLGVHHAATHLLPDGQRFPCEWSTKNTDIKSQTANLRSSLLWLQNDFLSKYGAAEVCRCASNQYGYPDAHGHVLDIERIAA